MATTDKNVLSAEQWETLAVFDALENPVPMNITRNLVSLSVEGFLNAVNYLKKVGWLQQTEPDYYRLDPNLPDDIRLRLKELNDPSRLSGLLSRISDSGVKRPLGPTAVSALSSKLGGRDELAQLELSLARNDIQNGKLLDASQHLENTVLLLEALTNRPDLASIFVSAMLDLWKVRMRIGHVTNDTLQLMGDARAVAKRIGDRRSEAMINLNLGCSSFATNDLVESIADLNVGLQEIEEIDDDDFQNQAAEFRGFYYFFQGRYQEAIGHFDHSIQSIAFKDDKILNLYGYYLYGYCAAYLGQFHSSLGFIQYCYRFFSEKAGPREAIIFEQALGIILIMTGKAEEGYLRLQSSLEKSIAHDNIQSFFLAKNGLSYYHFREGRIEESYITLCEGMAEAVKGGFKVRNYTYPWVLEQFYAFQQRGYDFQELPYVKHGCQSELQRIIEGPNIHQKGIAHRILAVDRAENDSDVEFVLSNLELSEGFLKRSGDPIELAKTRFERARMQIRTGSRGEAVRLVNQAREKTAKYSFFDFPEDLKPLLKADSGIAQEKNADVQILDSFLELLSEFTPSSDLNELQSRLVRVLAKFYGAERGGLFWFKEGKQNALPVLKAAWNLAQSELSTVGFKSTSLEYILSAYKNNQPLMIQPKRDSGYATKNGLLAVLCLPFEVEGRVKGVLYFDNSYIENFIESLDKSLLLKISRHLSLHIERTFKYSHTLERKMLSFWDTETRKKDLADGGIIGESPAMTHLLAKADHIASIDASVMILGETGAGKGLLARRIHDMSPRATNPFVVVDISTIPENLIESELFGHEKGAFTGADRQKPGRLELAHNGTLFIDEVGEIPRLVQPKLLRALEENAFVRIGGVKTLKSNFRLITATNRNLEAEVARGNFRQDLFYRLNVISFEIPPLRERDQDVILLARHFLKLFSQKYGSRKNSFSEEETARLIAYHWPGNVRELRNIIERYVLLSTDERLESLMPGLSNSFLVDSFSDTPTMDELQRRYIRYLLDRTGGKIGGPGGVADLLDMNRTTLYTRMKKLGIS